MGQSRKYQIATWLIIVLALSHAMAGSLVRAGDDDKKLAESFKNWLDQSFALQPYLATRLGDYRFAGKLEDMSSNGRTKVAALTRITLAKIKRDFDKANLSSDSRVDFECWQNSLEKFLWIEENLSPAETDPRVYNEYASDSTYLLLTQTTLSRAAIVSSILSRMEKIPALLEQAKINLSGKGGKVPARVLVETAIRQNKGSIAWYKSGLAESLGAGNGLDAITNGALVLLPCIVSYQKFLEEDLLPRANGEWRLGREKFTSKLDYELEANIGSLEVLAEAEKEFERVEAEMASLARCLWPIHFPGVVQQLDTLAGRQETIRRVVAAVSQERGTVTGLVGDAKDSAFRLKDFIRKRNLLRLPEPDRCDIVEMPEFQRGNSVAYLNNAPPLDFEARSIYAISPPPKDWDIRRVDSFLEEYNHRMMQILTLHEAYPGHYVQLEYANRNPSVIRRVLASGVYIEGWAVHMEQVMLDEGYGAGDLGLRLLQLKWYLRAVANAILDHRMHCDGWTDGQALQFLVGRAFQSEGEAIGKIIRSKQSSCQLSTYFVGRMAMHRLRQQTQARLGDQFALLPYHQAVLEVGPVPVRHLPPLVEAKLKLGPK